MRSRLCTACALLAGTAVLVLLVIQPSVTAQDKDKLPRVKWEHGSVSQDKLGEMGDQGWELVAVTGGQPFIDSSRTIPGTTITQNTIKYAPLLYHIKRQK